MGYLPLTHLSTHFIDLRGLGDKRVAKMWTYPHCNYGVAVSDVLNPKGEMRPYLLQCKPDWIANMQFDQQPHTHDNDPGPYKQLPRDQVMGAYFDWAPMHVWRRVGN
jgi:hypothetical protein